MSGGVMTDQPNTMGRCLDVCLVSTALDGMRIGLVTLDTAGRISWANRQALRVLDTRLSECTGKQLRQMLRDPQFSAFWHEVENTPKGLMAEIRVHWPRAMTLKVNATTCVDGNGVRIGRALLFCDVTAERSVQVQLSEEATNRLLRMTEVQPPQMEPGQGLTAQEMKVLGLVGEGLGNDEIARRLFVATSTVRSHLKQVYRKTGLSSRAEAVRYSVENGLNGCTSAQGSTK